MPCSPASHHPRAGRPRPAPQARSGLHAPVLSVDEATRQADAVARRLDGGTVLIFAGPVPGDVHDPLTVDHELLVGVPLADPSAPPAVDGLADFYPRPSVPILRSGKPSFFRAYTTPSAYPPAFPTAVFQGTAGPEADDSKDDPDLIVPDALEDGGTLELRELTYRSDRGTA